MKAAQQPGQHHNLACGDCSGGPLSRASPRKRKAQALAALLLSRISRCKPNAEDSCTPSTDASRAPGGCCFADSEKPLHAAVAREVARPHCARPGGFSGKSFSARLPDKLTIPLDWAVARSPQAFREGGLRSVFRIHRNLARIPPCTVGGYRSRPSRMGDYEDICPPTPA